MRRRGPRPAFARRRMTKASRCSRSSRKAVTGSRGGFPGAQNAQAAAADPRGTSFATILTREEIAALSDDPAEMLQQLQDLAGGRAPPLSATLSRAPAPPPPQ